MTNTIEQVIAYARAHPLRDGKSWNGWCESFIWRAGGFDRSFPTALAAGDASGPLRKDWAAAPSGAIHYWAGVGGDGHVAFSLGGGMLLMASGRTSNFGTALGTLHFSNYGLPLYRGWTMRHGTQTLRSSVAAAAVSTTTPIVAPIITPKKGKTMQLFVHRVGANMAYYIASETQLIGPLVMSAGRLKGVVALYGPPLEVWDDGLDGVRDVINTNVAQNKSAGVYDFAVKYSEGFKPQLSTVLHSMDSKLDGISAGGVNIDALTAKIIAALPKTGLTAADVASELAARLNS